MDDVTKFILSYAKPTLAQDDKWITVKPNGPDKTGRHALIGEGGEIKAGMGGQFTGTKIKDLKKTIGKQKKQAAKQPTRNTGKKNSPAHKASATSNSPTPTQTNAQPPQKTIAERREENYAKQREISRQLDALPKGDPRKEPLYAKQKELVKEGNKLVDEAIKERKAKEKAEGKQTETQNKAQTSVGYSSSSPEAGRVLSGNGISPPAGAESIQDVDTFAKKIGASFGVSRVGTNFDMQKFGARPDTAAFFYDGPPSAIMFDKDMTRETQTFLTAAQKASKGKGGAMNVPYGAQCVVHEMLHAKAHSTRGGRPSDRWAETQTGRGLNEGLTEHLAGVVSADYYGKMFGGKVKFNSMPMGYPEQRNAISGFFKSTGSDIGKHTEALSKIYFNSKSEADAKKGFIDLATSYGAKPEKAEKEYARMVALAAL